MMLSKKRIPFIYAVIWAIYYLQNFFGSLGSLLGTTCLLLSIGIGAYFAFIVIYYYETSYYIKGVNILVAMLTIYAFYYIFLNDVIYYGGVGFKGGGEISKYTTIKNAYLSFFPLYVFYWASKNQLIDRGWLKKFLLFWSVVSVLMFVDFQKSAIQSHTEIGILSDGITNNRGFEFITLIPFLLLVDVKDKHKTMLAFVFATFAFMSLKRGTIIIAILYLIIFIRHQLKANKGNKKILFVIGLSLTFCVFAYFIINLFEESFYAQERLAATLNGYSSGRDEIYNELWNHYFEDATFWEKLFGSGTDSTVPLAGNWAHNDWLEILTCQGLFGICIFVYYLIGLYRDKNFCVDTNLKLVLAMTLYMFLLKSLFSMSYPSFSTTVLLGYCLANRNMIKTINYR